VRATERTFSIRVNRCGRIWNAGRARLRGRPPPDAVVPDGTGGLQPYSRSSGELLFLRDDQPGSPDIPDWGDHIEFAPANVIGS
jgi:hypothetical protein